MLNELTACCNANLINVRLNPDGAGLNYPIAVDVEHDENGNMVCIGMYDDTIKEAHIFTEITERVKQSLERAEIIAHNGRTDFDCLRSWGIDVKDTQLVHDTELVAHILDSSRRGYGLKKLAEQDLGIVYPSYDNIVGKRTLKQVKERRTLDKWPVEILSLYNAMDVYCTYKLYEKQQKHRPNTAYFNDLERPIAFILHQMEARGVRVDLEYLHGLKRELEGQKAPIEANIKNELGDINLNSPKQLLEALHAKQIFPNFKGKPSTDKRALEGLRDRDIVQSLLRFSELDTLLSSFVTPYLERGTEIVHPWFNQCGTRTGRLSCSNPNLLQIPKRTKNGKRVRRMFIPRTGMLMGDCDFGQIEPRVLAHLSQDKELCKMFNDGIDFHSFTAERLGINRDRAKVLNLSVGYRATKYSVSRQLGGTLEEAQEQIDKWWSLFPDLRRWQEKTIYESRRSGFCTTLLGRRIKVDGLTESSWKREAAERQLINNITQGSAAEIIKLAMIKISQNPNLSKSFGLLVQVYDELLFELPISNMKEDMRIVLRSMKTAIKLNVPLTVSFHFGRNWAECH